MTELEQLEQAIAALEAQRPFLGEAVVEAALGPLRAKQATLEAATPQAARQPRKLTAQLEQQRKLASLLFMDIAGHTALTRHLDPEEQMEVIDQALARLAEPVLQHNGHVVRYQGDGFKAVFGLPSASEHDPDNAIRAGLAIQDTAREIAAELERDRHLAGFAVRVGIATGLVLAGGGTEGEDTVKGEPVNLAARLEQAAPVGGILIPHSTYQHVRGVFDLQPLEPLVMKGFDEPVLIYQVLAEKPRSFRTRRRGIEGIETRMVGREAELLELQRAFRKVMGAKQQREGGGRQFITITGEPGLGKSRLLYEFENWVDLQPATVTLYRGRARLETRFLPYGLLRDLFAFRFNLSDSDPAETAREKLGSGFQGTLGEDEKGEMKAHLIGHLLGYDFSGSLHVQAVQSDPQQLHNRALAYLAEYFRAVVARMPVLVWYEDLHWSDEASLDALATLALTLEEHPILMLATARPELYERRPNWMEAEAFHTRLDLRPLSSGDSLRLVDEVLQKVEELSSTFRDLVVDSAEGNPFYVEELIKMLIDEGVILTGEERWQVMVGGLGGLHIPPTLTGVLQARLDSLPAQERILLQQASVVGRVFWDAAVAYLDRNEGEGPVLVRVKAGLAALQRKEMVYRREQPAFTGTEEHAFKHAVLREVTYESVLKRMRQEYHARTADWLIRHSRERVGEFSGLIGEHLVQAGQQAEALVYLQRAGAEAAARFANEEALEYFGRALALTAQEPERRWELLLRREEVLDRLGRRAAQAADLQALEAVAGQLGDSGRQAEAALRRSRLGEISGNYPLGIQAAQQATAFAQAARDVAREAAGQIAWARALWRQGSYTAALERGQQALELARQAGREDLQAWALRSLGLIKWKQGDYPAARNYAQAALDLYKRIGDQRSTGSALNNLGLLAREQGDYPAMKRYLEAALAIARQTGDRRLEANGLCNLALGPYDLRDYTTAQGYFEQALAATRQVGDRHLETIVTNNLGDVVFCLGDFPTARGYFEAGLALARQVGDPNEEAASLKNLGLLAWIQGDAPAGLNLIEKVLTSVRRTGERREEGSSLICLGAVLSELGRVAEAWEHLAEASVLERKLGNRAKVMEALVGLAAAYWAGLEAGVWAGYTTGIQAAQAEAALEDVITYLMVEDREDVRSNNRIAGTVFGLRNYLLCVQALEAKGDPRAGEVLDQAHSLLEQQAGHIRETAARRSFLENIPWHREILERWQRRRHHPRTS